MNGVPGISFLQGIKTWTHKNAVQKTNQKLLHWNSHQKLTCFSDKKSLHLMQAWIEMHEESIRFRNSSAWPSNLIYSNKSVFALEICKSSKMFNLDSSWHTYSGRISNHSVLIKWEHFVNLVRLLFIFWLSAFGITFSYQLIMHRIRAWIYKTTRQRN